MPEKSYCPVCGQHDGAHVERYHEQRAAIIAHFSNPLEGL